MLWKSQHPESKIQEFVWEKRDSIFVTINISQNSQKFWQSQFITLQQVKLWVWIFAVRSVCSISCDRVQENEQWTLASDPNNRAKICCLSILMVLDVMSQVRMYPLSARSKLIFFQKWYSDSEGRDLYSFHRKLLANISHRWYF